MYCKVRGLGGGKGGGGGLTGGKEAFLMIAIIDD